MDTEIYDTIAAYCRNHPINYDVEDFEDWRDSLESLLCEKYGHTGSRFVSLWYYNDDDNNSDVAGEVLDFARNNKIIAHSEYWYDDVEKTLVAIVSTPFLIRGN